MALKVLQGPITTLLSTLDRVKAQLGITGTDDDDLLLDILTRASSAIARECGRPSFGVQTVQETIKGSGSQLLPLTCVPVLQVAQVLQDTDVVDPTDPSDGYLIEDAEAGALYRPSGWGQTVNLLSWGWEAYSSRYILPGGTQLLRYTVTYTAGYLLPGQIDYLPYDPVAGDNPSGMADPPPLPGDVEQACLETVKAWWFTRDRDPYVAATQVDDIRVQYNTAQVQTGALPVVALGLLRDYRRVN